MHLVKGDHPNPHPQGRERETLPVDAGDPVLRWPLPVDTDDGLKLLSGFDGYSCPKNPDFVEPNSTISLRINWVSIVIVFTEVSKQSSRLCFETWYNYWLRLPIFVVTNQGQRKTSQMASKTQFSSPSPAPSPASFQQH